MFCWGCFFNIFIAGKTQEALAAIENEFGHHVSAGAVGDSASANHIGSFAEVAFENLGHGAMFFAKFSSKKIAEAAAGMVLQRGYYRRKYRS